jgi:hypothetical protein
VTDHLSWKVGDQIFSEKEHGLEIEREDVAAWLRLCDLPSQKRSGRTVIDG